MAFLRTLFWIVVTVVIVVFSIHNWVPVTINLFGDLQADVKLPVLLLIAFLIGFVPLYIWHRISRWNDRRHFNADKASAPAPPSPYTAPLTPTPPPGTGPAEAD